MNLSQLPRPPKNKVTLWIPYEKNIVPKVSDFHIHCLPIVNLFETTTDPITVDYTRIEYPLVVNAQAPDNYEIHTILRLNSNTSNSVQEIKPFYDQEHEEDVYYSFTRRKTLMEDVTGSDMFIRFDVNNPELLKERSVVYGKVLATNRHKINELTIHDVWQSSLPIPGISLMSVPVYKPYEEQRDIWKLISQLSMNHLYFSDWRLSLSILKETLRLNGADEKTLDDIKGIAFEMSSARITRDGFHGYVRGVYYIEGFTKSRQNIILLVFYISFLLHK